MDNIEKLYKNFGILADSKEKISEHEKEYLEILIAVKGSPNEKRLASQFIARFFKHFPNLQDQAIDAHLDLCEDDDVAIRKQAIKDLPNLCKDTLEHLPKLADVLAQLLQSDDPSELSVVQSSLLSLFHMDAKGTLGGIFSQILSGEDLVRERALKFLNTKLRSLGPEVMTKEAEEVLLAESRKVLQDVTGEEFLLMMSILSGSRLSHTVSGMQELVEMVSEQVELDKPFRPESEHVDRLLQCGKQALPYFSSQVSSSRFVEYICDQVLSSMSDIPNSDESIDIQLEVLKLLAEMVPHAAVVDSFDRVITSVFSKLLEYMPLPPVEESTENDHPMDEVKLEFSYVECLLFTFHTLGGKKPDFLTADADRLRDFKLRLQYFARGLQAYIRKLKESLTGKSEDELKSEDNKLKTVALKTTSNINTLIKDLFHNPPHYNATISLSWKPLSAKEIGRKHTPITFDSSPAPKQPRQDKALYKPPGGKYSDKVESYVPPAPGTRGTSRGRTGRGFRGGYRGGRGMFRRNW